MRYHIAVHEASTFSGDIHFLILGLRKDNCEKSDLRLGRRSWSEVHSRLVGGKEQCEMQSLAEGILEPNW